MSGPPALLRCKRKQQLARRAHAVKRGQRQPSVTSAGDGAFLGGAKVAGRLSSIAEAPPMHCQVVPQRASREPAHRLDRPQMLLLRAGLLRLPAEGVRVQGGGAGAAAAQVLVCEPERQIAPAAAGRAACRQRQHPGHCGVRARQGAGCHQATPARQSVGQLAASQGTPDSQGTPCAASSSGALAWIWRRDLLAFWIFLSGFVLFVFLNNDAALGHIILHVPEDLLHMHMLST